MDDFDFLENQRKEKAPNKGTVFVINNPVGWLLKPTGDNRPQAMLPSSGAHCTHSPESVENSHLTKRDQRFRAYSSCTDLR